MCQCSRRSLPAVIAASPLWLLLGFAVIAAPGPASGDEPARDAYTDALRVVERSLAAHGGIDAVHDHGVTIAMAGRMDLAARLQGRSFSDEEFTPIDERIVFDPATERVAYHVDWSNYKFSRQRLAEIHDADRRALYVDKRAGSAGWMPFANVADARLRFLRYLPNAILADALDHRASLQPVESGPALDAVGYTTAAGDRLTLRIDRESRLLRSAAHVFDMELLGDSEIRWEWSDYREARGLQVPGRVRVFLAGRLLKDSRMDVNPGVDPEGFELPDGVEAGEPPELSDAAAESVPFSRRPGETRELAPGVYLAPSVRPGFHMFFVEFAEFVLAVDAPTGWYEIQQIPPSGFAVEEGTSALARKYIRTIEDAVPDKPVRFVALTHHHSDHIGGVREFIAEGTTLLAGPPAADAARAAARRPHTMEPDSLTGQDTEPAIEVVDGQRVIADDTMEVRLIELPPGNPKADGFLVVHVPEHRLLYLASFIYPVPEAAFPVPESLPLSLWFVRWLDESGPDVERIYNVHGQALIADWQLDRLREMLEAGDEPIAGE